MRRVSCPETLSLFPLTIAFQVCKQWNEILSQDSIYHSALFTTSFSHPLEISREAFEQAAFTDDRLRKLIFSKAKALTCNTNSESLVYRDGFLVWWARQKKGRFLYIDFNKTKPSSRRYTIKTKFRGTDGECSEMPVYAIGGGILVYTMSSGEVEKKNVSLRLVRFHRAVVTRLPEWGLMGISLPKVYTQFSLRNFPKEVTLGYRIFGI